MWWSRDHRGRFLPISSIEEEHFELYLGLENTKDFEDIASWNQGIMEKETVENPAELVTFAFPISN